MTRPSVLRLVKDRIVTMLPCFVLSPLGASESKKKAVASFTMIKVHGSVIEQVQTFARV